MTPLNRPKRRLPVRCGFYASLYDLYTQDA